MDKRNKEYEALIEKQREELTRYKKRFTDVVNAYKCLTKEKEVLEASLKALSQASSSPSKKTQSAESVELEDQEGNEVGNEDSCENLKVQLNTLMNSLATLSEEKSRMEAGFQADKKQLRAEKQQLESTIKDLEEKLEHETKLHLSEMENFKSKLISERHQREKEHNDHGVMIRELQKLTSEERRKREKAESEVSSLTSRVSETQERLSSVERSWSGDRERLGMVSEQLEAAKRGSGDTTSKLMAQLSALKSQLTHATDKEQKRVAEAEKRAQNLSELYEERVANLEARLAELSNIVGNTDKLRQADLAAIDKLKERLVQLELEHGQEKTDLSMDKLISRLKSIKELIDLANVSLEKPLDVKELYSEIFNIEQNNQDLHESCMVEYSTLKTEFESYKQKSHYINNMSFRNEPDVKVEKLMNEIKVLKEKVMKMHDHAEDVERDHLNDLETLKQTMIGERQRFNLKVECVEREWKKEVELLEGELVKQRERAQDLLSEKQTEIMELRQAFDSLIPDKSHHGGEANDEGGGMLHYSQEVARKDVELARLRKENYALQTSVREQQFLVDQRNRKISEQQTALTHQQERLNRCQSKEGANLEYLKNVVFNFLMSDDPASKSHMLNAIETVLDFSEVEKSKIRHHSWWYKVPLS